MLSECSAESANVSVTGATHWQPQNALNRFANKARSTTTIQRTRKNLEIDREDPLLSDSRRKLLSTRGSEFYFEGHFVNGGTRTQPAKVIAT